MKKKFVWIGVLLTLALVVVLLGYSATGTTRDAAARLPDLRTQAANLGIPTTLDEVPGPAPRETDNAAPLLVQAAERVGVDKKAAADLLVEAAKKNACVFPWEDLKSGAAWVLLKVDVSLKALLDTATEDLDAGDKAAFQRRAKAATRVAQLLSYSPTEGAFLRSVEAERQVYTWLADTMVAHPDDAFVMSVVQREAFSNRPVPSILVAFRRFFAEGNHIAQNHEIDGDQRVTWLWSKADFPTDPWGRDAVEATHLSESIELVEALNKCKDWPQAMKVTEETVDGWQRDKRPLTFSLRASSAAIRDLARKAAENEAARRVLFVAAGTFKHRLTYRQFPAASPIKGTMELDPFTGRPMKFSNLGTGFYVYGVGPDGFDSSGPVNDGLTVAEDVGFRLTAWPTVKETSRG